MGADDSSDSSGDDEFEDVSSWEADVDNFVLSGAGLFQSADPPFSVLSALAFSHHSRAVLMEDDGCCRGPRALRPTEPRAGRAEGRDCPAAAAGAGGHRSARSDRR